jgi:TonB family protein
MTSINRFSAMFLLSLPLYMSSCSYEPKSKARSNDTTKTIDTVAIINSSTSVNTSDPIVKLSPPQTVAEFLATRKPISEVDAPPPIDKAKTKTNPRFRAIEETEGAAPAISAEYSSNSLDDTSTVYTVVDQMPVFKGLSEFFEENSTSMDGYNMNSYTGAIKIGFIIDKYGYVKDARILKSSGLAEMDAEIIKTISKTSGKWKPGKIKGKAVNTRMTLPIIIELDE